MAWANILEFPGYQASSLGDILSFRQSREGKILKQRLQTNGYLQIDLRKDGKTYSRTVHTLIAAAFIGPCPSGMEVCHYDGDKTNNELVNLDYDTHENNMREMARQGLGLGKRIVCAQNHLLEPENIIWRKGRKGQKYRQCKKCHAASVAKWRLNIQLS